MGGRTGTRRSCAVAHTRCSTPTRSFRSCSAANNWRTQRRCGQHASTAAAAQLAGSWDPSRQARRGSPNGCCRRPRTCRLLVGAVRRSTCSSGTRPTDRPGCGARPTARRVPRRLAHPGVVGGEGSTPPRSACSGTCTGVCRLDHTASRGWTDDQLGAAEDRLAPRGLMDATGITDRGHPSAGADRSSHRRRHRRPR